MKAVLQKNGEFVTIGKHKIHVYRQGDTDHPTLVFMAGSATVAPVYDFKVLYAKLADNFHIIVIEKFGYGYSDIADSPCDVDSLVELQIQALDALDEKGPFILVAHSMSGLEAIRWKQKYPDRVKAIIGIDMATPLVYEHWNESKVAKTVKLTNLAGRLRLQKIPLLYPLSKRGLTAEECRQQKLLMLRNAFNSCYINEGRRLLANARTVGNAGMIECPMLLFSSNGRQIGNYWMDCQRKFAAAAHAKLICYDCGHYIHYEKSNEMSQEIITFLRSGV